MKGGNLPTRIGVFKGDYGWASNFAPVQVRLWLERDGSGFTSKVPTELLLESEPYQSVEHAYQASKFLDAKIRERFRLPGLSPSQAKFMAENLKQKGLVRFDWEEVNIEIMRGLLVQKFACSILRRKLLSTFSAELVEGNWWHDNFWGNCLCEDCGDKPGLNHLGRLLMEIRKGFIS